MKRLLLLPFFLGLFFSSVAQNKTALQVKTVNGIVEGSLEASGIRSFKGIPFAAPPVGELRWKEPQPVKNWTGVKKTVAFGPKPMQTNIFGDMNSRSSGMSEDCLYLNVWAPARSKKLLPVLVYFYGGGFVAGDGAELRYDGESMAKKGIVALTVNYRLGVFGLMAHPALSAAAAYKGSGNYGLLDQAAALRWVKNNIAAFGGDPARVTIAGESAGSMSVSALMASPLSRYLIAGAIGESGSLLGALPAIELKDAEKVGVEFANIIKASSLSDLRGINADTILLAAAKFGPFRFPVNVDGYFFPKNPYAIYEAGEQAKVPLLVGWNNEEMNYRMVMGADRPNIESFTKAINKLYKEHSEEILKLYAPANDAEVEQTATDLASDRFIAFSTWKWADVHSRTGEKKVYRYVFEKARPATKQESAKGLTGAKGAVHSAEIEYAMGNLSSNLVYPWTEDDYKVSHTMQDYFANFIISADPNGKGLPIWPAVDNSSEISEMRINVNTRSEKEKHRARYVYLDSLRTGGK